jgi:hypothetical protein
MSSDICTGMSSTKYVSYLIGKGGYLCPPIHLSGGAGVCMTGVGCRTMGAACIIIDQVRNDDS